MPNLADVLTSAEIVGYYNEIMQNEQEYPLAALFPAAHIVGTEIAFIKGRGNQPVRPLKLSAYDAQAPLRDRIPGQIVKEEMPFFRESMRISETLRKELNKLQNINNEYFNRYLEQVYKDDVTLIKAARAMIERMRVLLLTTGGIDIAGEGAVYTIDYGFNTSTQITNVTGTTQWKFAGSSDPYTVLKNAKKAANITGDAAAYMNSNTFAQIAASEKLIKMIVARKTVTTALTDEEIKEYIKTQLKIKIVVLDEVYTGYTYVDDNGNTVSFFPDDVVSMAPMGVLGETVFGETPEESDLLANSAEYKGKVTITDTGVAVVSKIDYGPPLQQSTIVSMACLPSCPAIDFLHVIRVNHGNTTQSVTSLPVTGKFGINYTFSQNVVGTGTELAPQYAEGDVYVWNGETYEKVEA